MLLEIKVKKDSKYANRSIIDSDIPEEILIVMIKRDGNVLVPKGSTIIMEGDIVVLTGENLEQFNDLLAN